MSALFLARGGLICYNKCMEKECTKCHRMYRTTQEESTLCPDCLKLEFGSATPLNDAEHDALVGEYKWADRRQRQTQRHGYAPFCFRLYIMSAHPRLPPPFKVVQGYPRKDSPVA